MNFTRLLTRHTIDSFAKSHGRFFSQFALFRQDLSSIAAPVSPFIDSPTTLLQNPNCLLKPIPSQNRCIHSTSETRQSYWADTLKVESGDSEEEDAIMNDFLSRFVWIMRGKLTEFYTDCDKQTIDAMVLVIVGKVVSELEKGGLEQMIGEASTTHDFSEDLWKTVWEVSNSVLEDMNKEKKKEKMKGFLQCKEVAEMVRFAGQVGVRGDMLREFRFKWAREKMEETEFYESLGRLARVKEEEIKVDGTEGEITEAVGTEDKSKVGSIPTRHGKLKYKIYGLDLSDPKWAEVANKTHEAEEVFWPQEEKPISGKCKMITERIISLKEEDDPSQLLVEWEELLQPSRIDWMALLDKLEKQNVQLFYKVAELVLNKESFQSNIRDYSKLIDAHAKQNRLVDAEKILEKMNENGILPDIITSNILVHMYSKAGNLDRAKQAFESLRSYGFQPDPKLYDSMIMAYVNAGQPKLGESLLREMEARDIKPTEDIFIALLRSYSQCGDVVGAGRIAITMQFAGLQPSLESCTLLVEAYGRAGDPEQARNNFDYMIKVGHKPDDRCTASMIAAYEKKNLLDKALDLLLNLEKDGFEPGIATYSVLVDWLGKLQLVDEAEQVLSRIAEQGEAPPLNVHVSLCDMYSRAGVEKKALQALGVLEAKKDELGPEGFERIITGLIGGGFVEDARRIHGIMEGRGFVASEPTKVSLMACHAFDRNRPTLR